MFDPTRTLRVHKYKRRSSVEILYNILQAATLGLKKTPLLFKVNLNPRILEKYLDFCLRNGLITHEGKIFKTTEKGLKFIESYRDYTEYTSRLEKISENLKAILQEKQIVQHS
ncbi:MAG: winged helix-turn-helix domain-containing protein [Thermoprotei archaeon]